MTRARAWSAALLVTFIAQTVGQAAAAGDRTSSTTMSGPMPLLGPAAKPESLPGGFAPAPTPNVDLFPPRSDSGAAYTVLPGLTNHESKAGLSGDGYTPGSSYSTDLERRSRPGTAIGNTLAPSINLHVPLQ